MIPKRAFGNKSGILEKLFITRRFVAGFKGAEKGNE